MKKFAFLLAFFALTLSSCQKEQETELQNIVPTEESSVASQTDLEIMQVSAAATYSDLPNDRWVIRNPVKSGSSLQYDMVYKATHNVTITDLYTLTLYTGVYDGIPGCYRTDWGWEYNALYNRYYPPVIDQTFGSLCLMQESGFTNPLIIKAGTTYSRREMSHQMRSDLSLSDIECVIIYIKESSPQERRYDDITDL